MTTNSEAWDRIAQRHRGASAAGTISYGPDVPTEAELRLCGDIAGKRVLELGCGTGENAVTIALTGAHVIAIDAAAAPLSVGRRMAEGHETSVEWRRGDAADLAFLRADSIDIALSIGMLAEVEDIDRLFRQVHRVLKPGAPFVFSYDHPMALAIGRDDSGPGALPLGNLEVRQSYFDAGPAKVVRDGEDMTLFPRTIGDVFAALHRAGYRVDALLEPEPLQSADPGPAVPTTVIWRARKEGL